MTMSLHHLVFRTGDVASLARFYCDMFGWKVVRDALPRSLWLGLGDDAVLMIEAREAGEPAAKAGAKDLVAFRVDEFTRAEVGRKARETGCDDGQTEFTTYLRDPDGRRIGVSTYDFSNTR